MSQVTSSHNIRRQGINLNHWYVLARSFEVQAQPLGLTLWHQPIVLFRDTQGHIHALEDCCPHRLVRMSHGIVAGDQLECAYHGWRFDATGRCSWVPHLAEHQKLPTCRLRRYPVREQDGFIWVFPGEPALAEQCSPLGMPEWEDLNYIATVSSIDCPGHFSYLIENLMDMHHGHLHQEFQAWAEATLESLEESSTRVDAHYQAQSYYRIDRMWSVAQLFIPALRQLHPEPLDVSYVYPHWMATLGQDFKIYCLFCPVHETQTRGYLIHFTSLNRFPELLYLPKWFRRFLKNRLFGAAQHLLDGLVKQDVQMIRDEQQAYLQHPERRIYELNRALVSVQRLIRTQVNPSGESTISSEVNLQ
ncbi:3-chlorobenzoate-3,4-dioxygenase [Neosynechococcus sphagnicola sy1]|uniref:3-chlorobenzoate-3,4-dioxygenase n=1 Tax=Neosynechococcus sphagnicola sy1 TaxID=1497020 RepID=A0A098TJK2_9CYAN|nr:3-chlorobenzoate-3,4-dioxygenase [Neosynechococcus sphagnicola sy1]